MGTGSIIFKGTTPIIEKQMGGGTYVKLADKEFITGWYITPKDDLITIYEHFFQSGSESRSYTCIGEDCPLCAVGNKRRYVTLAVLLTIPQTEGAKPEVKVMKQGVKFWKLQVELFEEYGTSNDRPYKIKRSGSNFNDTSYSPMPLKEAEMPAVPEGLDIPDLMDLIAPKTQEELTKLVGSAEGKPTGDSGSKLAPY